MEKRCYEVRQQVSLDSVAWLTPNEFDLARLG